MGEKRRFAGMARAFTTVILILAIAACGGGPRDVQRATKQWPQGQPCLDMLAANGSAFRPIGDINTTEGCGIRTGIVLEQSLLDLNRPADLSCKVALALNQYESQVVLPAARRHFGQGVRRIHHVGAYVCRPIAGSNRLSEHGRGRAIDIAGFELDDGRVINIHRDWRGAGSSSAFLRDVARGACPIFHTVLTPNTDAAHADHFHLDLGEWVLCSV